MNIVISDPKTGKAYSKKIDSSAAFANKRIGENVELGEIGLGGYEAKISGGSDKQGFPMKKDLKGAARQKIFVLKDKKSGTKIRISKRGNTVSEETSQLNLTVTKHGTKTLEELLPKEGEVKEEKKTAKELAIEQSLKIAEGQEELKEKPKGR
ncbi:MAG: S6e family ribosomal protein [Candidatus Diapherotrites archaeon]